MIAINVQHTLVDFNVYHSVIFKFNLTKLAATSHNASGFDSPVETEQDHSIWDQQFSSLELKTKVRKPEIKTNKVPYFD